MNLEVKIPVPGNFGREKLRPGQGWGIPDVWP